MKLFVVVYNKSVVLEVLSNKQSAERCRKRVIIDRIIDETPHMEDIGVMKKLQETSRKILQKRSVNYLMGLYNKGFKKKLITDLSIVTVDTDTKLFRIIDSELENFLDNVKEDLYFSSTHTKQQKNEIREDKATKRNTAAGIIALMKYK